MNLGSRRQNWLSALLAVVVCMGGSSLAGADEGLEVDVEPVRDWPMPTGFDASTASVDASVDGIAVLLADSVVGDEDSPGRFRCEVVTVTDTRARFYDYQHEFRTTHCIDAIAHPDGGFFVRGAIDIDHETVGQGFTARIDEDANLVWAVDDEDVIHGPEAGGFSGNYAGAVAGLAYDEATDHLLALSVGEQVVPESTRRIEHAHIIDADSGQVQLAGQAFGARARDQVVDVVARDGAFLIHAIDDVDQSPRFYSFEVGRSMTQFEPESADWSQREVVVPIRYRRALGTFMLWVDEESTPRRSGLFRVEGLDSVVWSEEFGFEDLVDPQEAIAVEPERMWAGSSMVAMRFRADGPQPVVQFFDVDNGMPLAAVPWFELSEFEPLDLVRHKDGRLRVLALDSEQDQIWEYALELRSDGEDGSSSDEDEDLDDEASGCSTVAGDGPGFGIVLLLLFAAPMATRLSRLNDCEK